MDALLFSISSYIYLKLTSTKMVTASPEKGQAEVILVGCGCPLRGMGWYHAVQLLGNECPSAKLTSIVEPWFMGAGTFYPHRSKQLRNCLSL